MFRCVSSVAGASLFLLLVLSSSVPTEHQEVAANNRVDVTLYYESLCPDSIRFVANQLWPTWRTMAPFMNIRFVPFGKSESAVNSDGETVFACQHGPRECSGNKMQSCALSMIGTQDMQVNFVTCAMTSSDPTTSGPRCTAQVGVDYQNVEQCYQGSKGVSLQLTAEQETNSIRKPLKFVPTIVYNGQFNQRKQDESLQDFKGVLCEHIPQPPPECY